MTSGENCTGINKSSVVIHNPDGTFADANVIVDGFSITISSLGAGNYTVYYNNTVNSNWNGASNFTGITVLKANSSVSASDVEVTYGDSIMVIVSSENATKVSYQIIKSGAIVKEGTINVGENITDLDLAAGEYTVNLTTVVNGNYISSNYTSKITVNPANSSVIIDSIADVTYGEDIIVTYSVENKTNLNITVTNADGGAIIAGVNANVEGKVIISGLDTGKYTIAISNAEDGNHSSSNAEATFNVLKANSTIYAENKTFTYPKDVIIVAHGENCTGINESSVVVRDLNGVVKATVKVNGFKMTISGLGAGEYTVIYNNTVGHNWISAGNIAGITILKANSSVSTSDVEVTYGNPIIVVVESDNATEISYHIIGSDGTITKGTINTGKNITGLDLAVGEYTVNLTTIVNGNYTTSNYTSKITVNPANSTVKAEDVEVTYGDSIVVIVSSENATSVSYKVIGADGIVKQGTANVNENITGLDLAAGKYTVNLTTVVNGNYTSSNYTSKITVNPANSTVKAEDVEVTYGDSIVVVVTSENATGVSYQVISADGIVKQGTANVNENITGLDLAAGEYTLNLTTIVNGNYTSSNYTSKITVNPANSTVKAEDVEVTYGEAIIIPVSAVNAIALYYDVFDENNTVVASDIIQAGSNITVNDLAAGSYNVTLITGVDLNHTSVRNASKIIVNRAGSSVSAEDVTVNFEEAISIPVSSANATEISYKITDANDNAVVNGTVKPGKAINVSDLAAGDYTVSLTTVVDANHSSVSNSSKLHIKHVVTITISPITGYAGEVVNFTAQFKYENGDPVNGGTAGLAIRYDDRQVLGASMYSILGADDTYSTGVSGGKATFNVKLGNPGIYPYVVTYSGDDVDAVQAESTVTILKLNTTVSVDDISGKPSDEKSITINILDQNNNTVNNGTVTLNLNGKTYNATVDNGKQY